MKTAPRPSWDEYFMAIAQLASSRSTCLANPVGAVIVKNKHVISTGYNAPPAGASHCTEQGFCYSGLNQCDLGTLPSRAIHAEANAIAHAARHGSGTEGAQIYVTSEPCIACLKLIIASGIQDVIYGEDFNKEQVLPLRDLLVKDSKIGFRRFIRGKPGE